MKRFLERNLLHKPLGVRVAQSVVHGNHRLVSGVAHPDIDHALRDTAVDAMSLEEVAETVRHESIVLSADWHS